MHLAIVTPFPPRVTGIGQYGFHVACTLARSGAFHRITVLTEMTPDAYLSEMPGGMTVERIWRPDRMNVGREILTRLWHLRPDLVWFNLGVSIFGRSPLANVSGLLSLAAVRVYGLRTVVTLHEMVEQANLRELGAPASPLVGWLVRLFVRLLVTQANVVCVTLKRHAYWLASRWPNRRVVYIPHGAFDPPQALPGCGDQELLIFGSLAPFKGLELLLDVFRELHAHNPALRLTVAGAEHPRFPDYLRRVRTDFGDHPTVSWLGYVPESELRDVFARATIVVLPYTAATGSSSVLYRAATWGRPIVVSDVPALRAAVEEAGFQAEFFRSGNRRDLASTLQRLLAAPAVRAAQARHNCGSVARMTLEETCQTYLHAFELALTRQPNPMRARLALQGLPRRR